MPHKNIKIYRKYLQLFYYIIKKTNEDTEWIFRHTHW